MKSKALVAAMIIPLYAVAFAPSSPYAPTRLLKFTGSAGQYVATLKMGPMPKMAKQKTYMFGGSSGSKSPIVVDLDIRVGKTFVFVPRSCFSDLSEVSRLQVERTKRGCKILIEGSDASEGYDAVIEVVGRYVVSRSVRNGEFPEYHYEMTKYVNKEPPE